MKQIRQFRLFGKLGQVDKLSFGQVNFSKTFIQVFQTDISFLICVICLHYLNLEIFQFHFLILFE